MLSNNANGNWNPAHLSLTLSNRLPRSRLTRTPICWLPCFCGLVHLLLLFDGSCVDRLRSTSYCPERPCTQGLFVPTCSIARHCLVCPRPHLRIALAAHPCCPILEAFGRDTHHTSAASTAGPLVIPPRGGQRRSRSEGEAGKGDPGGEEHRRACGLTLPSRARARCARAPGGNFSQSYMCSTAGYVEVTRVYDGMLQPRVWSDCWPSRRLRGVPFTRTWCIRVAR